MSLEIESVGVYQAAIYVVQEWISVGKFRAKEKITAKPQQIVDWTFAERARR